MLKRWFPLSFQEQLPPEGEAPRNGSTGKGEKPEPHKESEPAHSSTLSALTAAISAGMGKYMPFEQIYNHAAVKPPRLPYGILKVADMLSSPHLSGMSPETKRCSLLMALEAAGAELEDLLQDAVVRQRALNDYEEAQKSRLKEFEQVKADENSKIQAELDRLTSQYMSRIQSNLDEVAREQDNFHSWQKRRHQESQRITEAAALCVPQAGGCNGSSLMAVLERATAVQR
jgi:hypothetical protein